MRNSTTLLFIVLSIAIAVFFVYPKYNDIKELQAQEAEYNEALDKAQQFKSLRDTLIKKYNSIDKVSVDLLKKVVPEKFDPTRLTAVFNSIAGKYGMILSDVDIKEDVSSGRETVEGEVVDQKPYKIVQIVFTLKGSYQSFISTLSDIERNIQIVDVRRISIREQSFSSVNKELDFQVSVDSYWIK